MTREEEFFIASIIIALLRLGTRILIKFIKYKEKKELEDQLPLTVPRWVGRGTRKRGAFCSKISFLFFDARFNLSPYQMKLSGTKFKLDLSIKEYYTLNCTVSGKQLVCFPEIPDVPRNEAE